MSDRQTWWIMEQFAQIAAAPRTSGEVHNLDYCEALCQAKLVRWCKRLRVYKLTWRGRLLRWLWRRVQ